MKPNAHLEKRFKEHTNLTTPTGVGDHCNATRHSVSLDNTKVLTREPQWTKRKVKSAPSMNREQGYQLPLIYHQLLLPEHLPRKKTSRDQGFWMRDRNVVKFQETRSKVSEKVTFQCFNPYSVSPPNGSWIIEIAVNIDRSVALFHSCQCIFVVRLAG